MVFKLFFRGIPPRPIQVLRMAGLIQSFGRLPGVGHP